MEIYALFITEIKGDLCKQNKVAKHVQTTGLVV